VGVQFKLWMDPLAPPLAQILPSKCCHEATRGRAKKVAEDLDIPLHELDLSDEFKKEVVDPFLEGYKEGKTPNPCIGCNRTIKFGRLLEFAEEMGCEKLATGHYARVAEVVSDASSAPRLCHPERSGAKRHVDEGSEGRDGACAEQRRSTQHDTKYLLLEAIDKTKDQSYYLYGLSQEQLSRILFPLGSMTKKEVFALARSFGVPLPLRYQESQDLCFFPEKKPHAFLDRYLSPEHGDIIDTAGRRRGTHRGLPHYTEGQRQGLGIGGLKIPLHVVAKDTATNTITVGTREEAEHTELRAENLQWISYEPEPHMEHTFDARIHSLGQRNRGFLVHDGKSLQFRFQKSQIGVSPGQSIVLYRGEEIVGGGVIC